MSGDEEKKKFRIEDLSESTRKKIFAASLVVMMAALFIFWTGSISKNFSTSSEEKNNQELEEIKKQLSEIGQVFEESRQAADELKQQFQELSSATTTTSTAERAVAEDISEEELKKIKNIILENTQETTE